MQNKSLTDKNCIFCKIIAGEIPCAKIYEDSGVIAFLDINPISRGHALIVPKAHYPTLLEFPDSLGAELFRATKTVAEAVFKATKADGFNVVQNNFSAAGQMVFHAHWHIIPRFDNDGLNDWPSGSYADTEEMQQLAKSVNALIQSAPAGG